jgi:ABC-type dipeptide/oligopeptide/nickel transport system permease component
MGRYILRRLLIGVAVLFVVSAVVFYALSVVTGDPALIILGQEANQSAIDALHRSMGLDRSLIAQYWTFLSGILQGDLGRSYISGLEVTAELQRTWPATFVLAVSSIVIAGVVGVGLGVLSAVYQGSWFDRVVQILVLTAFSMPIYWLGLLLVLVFSLQLNWFPASGFDSMSSLVLPAITLSTWSLASIQRMTRSSMLDSLTEDYVRVARSRGIPPSRLYGVHALRPALNPVITILGLQLGALLTGAVLTEVVFDWPGVGQLMIESVFTRDYPMIRGVVLTAAVVFVIVNILTDIMYALADPRVRHAKS